MKNKIQILMLFFVVLIQAQQNITLPAPVNDEVSGAFEIQNGNCVSNYPANGTNIGATISVVPVTSCDILRKDTWFFVLVPPSGTLTIETSQADSNSIYDTVIAVYSIISSTLVLVECNDDLDALSGFSRIELTGRQDGEKLYVSVWRFGDSGIGNFKVSAFDASILSSVSNDAFKLNITPNPTTSLLTISGLQKDFDYEIYNVIGQKITTAKIIQTQPSIDVSNLANGTYVLKIRNEKQNTTHRFIKI